MKQTDDIDSIYFNPCFAPGLSHAQIAAQGGDLSLGQRITVFEARYRVWLFDYAQRLLWRESEGVIQEQESWRDSGFAVLAILNPYFDITGKLCGDFPDYPYKAAGAGLKQLSSEDFIKAGINEVFPDLLDYRRSLRQQIVNRVYGEIRNGIAHRGLTGRAVILDCDRFDEPIRFGYSRIYESVVIVINWVAWYLHLRAHFEAYVSRLRGVCSGSFTDEEGYLKKFGERFQ